MGHSEDTDFPYITWKDQTVQDQIWLLYGFHLIMLYGLHLNVSVSFLGWFLLFPRRIVLANNIWSVLSHACMSFVARNASQPLPSPMSFAAEQTLYGVA